MTHPTRASAGISAILPVYNGVRHVRGALRSVLAQTVQPDQLVIMHDGSTDDSVQVVEAALSELAPTFETLILEQPNQGQSAARNAAVRHATGELLAFLDQDDLWHPRHLEQLAAGFDRDEELGWCYSDFSEIDGDGHIVTRDFIKHHGFTHPKKTVGQLLGQDNMVLPSASVIRKEAFDEVGGFDPRLRGYEDDDLFIRMFRAGWTTCFVEESLTMYRVHSGGSSANGSFRRSRMVFFEKIAEVFPDDPGKNRFYMSDLVVPRLLTATIAEYIDALRYGRWAEAREIADCADRILAARERVPAAHRMAIGLMRWPRLSKIALRWRRSLPRFMRPRIGPANLLRD